MNLLIVRLGALGDIVHTIPAAAALRAAMPAARIDWLVDSKHREILDLVPVIDRVVTLDGRSIAAWIEAVRQLRFAQYDAALDFQGLLKSAVFARASGARQVAGFSIWHLREKTARPFYSVTSESSDRAAAPDDVEHVIHKNLSLLRVVGVHTTDVAFPFVDVVSPAVVAARASVGTSPFALINPGAAWPNKRWPPERYGEVATFLRDVRGLASIVLWGPAEEALAQTVVQASAGAARLAPATGLADLLALARAAALIVSGDTGPLHVAAAAGTPVVAIFGPTNPERNGPWLPQDITVSRYPACSCHYDRKCHQATWCLNDVTVAEVTAAIQQRLGHDSASRSEDPHGTAVRSSSSSDV